MNHNGPNAARVPVIACAAGVELRPPSRFPLNCCERHSRRRMVKDQSLHSYRKKKMGQLRDINTYFNKVRPKSCPCNLTVDKFMSNYQYESKGYDSNYTKEILLITDIPEGHEDFLMLTRKHSLILSQRYHPDKHIHNHVLTCQTTMKSLNKALCAVEETYH